jgi:DNA-binding NarL/FixJ family response regulator
MTNVKPITIMLVEDHQITRLGLRYSLEKCSDFQIVAEAADGLMAVTTAARVKPAIILMDIGLPGISGIEAASRIKKENEKVRILMLTSHELEEDVFAALSANCDGYCLKAIESEQLVAAIRAVNQGGTWLDPSIAKVVVDSYVKRRQVVARPGKASLSERELEILSLVVDGLTNCEIAQRLVLSAETVKTHMRHILEKLAVNDRTQAAVKALRDGLV